MRILILCPARAGTRHGNRVTALRWARILRGLGHRVALQEAFRPYNKVVSLRGGLLGKRPIDGAGLTRMALLPSREVLLGRLAGGMRHARPIDIGRFRTVVTSSGSGLADATGLQ